MIFVYAFWAPCKSPITISFYKSWACKRVCCFWLIWSAILKSRATPAARLWPDQPDDKARSNLRWAINNLANLLPSVSVAAMTVLLVWFGVAHGLRPLGLLRQALHVLDQSTGSVTSDRAEQLQLLFSRPYDTNWFKKFEPTR